MKKYQEMVEELRAYGDQLVNEYYDSEIDKYGDFIDEVECMTTHCECCQRILEKALK